MGNIVHVVTTSDFIEEYPVKVFKNKNDAEKYCKDNETDKVSYNIYSCEFE
jgi:hypothetical protein